MNIRKVFPQIRIRFFWLLLFSLVFSGNLFAATGGAKDGQMMFLVILALLIGILGFIFFVPMLVHRIKDLWNKYHHC